MDALEVILTRRSIRKFTGDVISDDDIKTLLRAGFAAPSAHNRQPWEFIVVKDKLKLDAIAKEHPYAKMLSNASCGIIVCGDNSVQTSLGFLIADCAAVTENILLAAHSKNLGAVWCGLYPERELTDMIKRLCHLSDDIVPVSLIAVGHKVVEKPAWNRYIDEKIHYDKW